MTLPNNHPLPNLSLASKLGHSALLLLGVAFYAGTWLIVLRTVYAGASGEGLGVDLGQLAASDSRYFVTLLVAHAGGMLALLAGAYTLFRRTSLRRRVRAALAILGVTLALIDVAAWLYAPQCSSTNIYLGVFSLLAALPLVVIAFVPLYQMWVYTRWRPGPPAPQHVVIVGGGFAGLYTALGLDAKLGYHPALEITVIDRRNYFLFPPLLPSAAAGTIETRQVSYPFRRIFETTNVRFRKVDVSRIDPQARVVYGTVEVSHDPTTGAPVSREAEFPYDLLILAPGSTTQTFNTKGVADHAFFMRELNDAIVLRNHVIDCFERAAVLEDRAEQAELLRFVVVGAGPTGIETATEIYDLIHHVLLKRYPELDLSLPEVLILQSANQVLPGWHPEIVRMAAKQLERMGIKTLFQSRVTAVTPTSVTIGPDTTIATRSVLWCAGVRPVELLAKCGLPLDGSGRIAVREDLRPEGFDNVFVLGDAAHLVDPKTKQPLPPLGQVAFQQGSHAARNLIRQLLGRSTRPFRYFNFGGLVSVGEHFAAVQLMGIRLSGFIGWFIWRTLYLAKIVGLSNKIRIVIDWTLDLLIERSISQIRDAR